MVIIKKVESLFNLFYQFNLTRFDFNIDSINKRWDNV